MQAFTSKQNDQIKLNMAKGSEMYEDEVSIDYIVSTTKSKSNATDINYSIQLHIFFLSINQFINSSDHVFVFVAFCYHCCFTHH